MQPTIVLIHGAFAESASWDAVIDRLLDSGYPVVAAPNPLRSLSGDAASVANVVRAVEGPVVLVAHSYGGAVMTNVPADAGDIVGLVYVNAFAPEPGETCFALAGMFPGSQLGETTLRPVANSDGSTDLFIKLGSFHEVFCPDLSDQQAARMAVTQRPATQEALVEPSGAKSLWKELPSWFLIGEQDHVIPAALQDYMAKRAGAHRVLEIPGASHAALVSHPNETAHLILEATTAHVAA